MEEQEEMEGEEEMGEEAECVTSRAGRVSWV